MELNILSQQKIDCMGILHEPLERKVVLIIVRDIFDINLFLTKKSEISHKSRKW